MSIIRSSLSKMGFGPKVRRITDTMGYSLVPAAQDPEKNWMGLRNLPIRTILDIGACTGSYARDFLRHEFPSATIHSFEPSPVAYRDLSAVAAGSGGKIVAHNVGLGDENGSVTFNSTKDFIYSSSILPVSESGAELFPQIAAVEQFEVEVRRLDDVAKELIPAIDGEMLIKIDVQGFEDRVIRGGRETIAKASACIAEINVRSLYEGQPTFDTIYMEMTALGFVFSGTFDQYFDDQGNLIYFDAVFTKPR